MKPYYEQDGVTIYHGDALDVLPAIDGFDGIVADPPYCSGGRQQTSARAHAYGHVNGQSEADWFLGDNMGTDTYLWWLRHLGKLLIDRAEVGTHFYCFTDWRQYGTVVTALESVGWTLRNCVVWDKTGGGMGGFWRNRHEMIPVFSKGQARKLPNGGFFNVLRDSKPQNGHPTAKPLAVVERLVEASGAECVIDPFAGSGTTLHAARNLGRAAIGIEVAGHYCALAARRLGEIPPRLEEMYVGD